MSQRNIDFGAFPDDPSADAIRTAFQKVQQNFSELYSGAGSGVTSIVAGQGIQLGGTGSSTGTVIIEADIACIQVQSTTLALGVLGSTSEQSYVLIPDSSQILTIDLPTDLVVENLEVTGNLQVLGNTTLGNTVTANYFIGDGGLLSNIMASGGSLIDNGNSNVKVLANSNVTVSISGNADVATFSTTGLDVSGNVTANYFIGDGGLLSNISGIGTGNSISSGNSNVVVDANSDVRVSVSGTSNVLVVGYDNAALAGNLVVTGGANIGGGSGGNISGANYITANFFVGDGGLLTNISGVSGSQLVNGNSNVIVDANSNVRISAAGTANIINISNTAIGVSGNIVPSANVTYNLGSATNRFKDLFLAGNTIYLGNLILSDTANDFTVTGNVVSENATLGNVVTANFFVGDGGLLSNITSATASTANTANTANIANAVVGYTKIPFVYNTSSPLNLALIPAGSVVNQVMIVINEAFNDANATLTVGTIASTSQLVSASDIQTNQVGTYVVMPGQLYLSETQVVLSITPGSSTTGNGMIIINY